MAPNDLRPFAHRDWASAARAKQQYWVDCFQRDGSAPARHAATVLLEHARRLGAVGPADDRAGDFAHHVEIRDRLDRAARAFARR